MSSTNADKSFKTSITGDSTIPSDSSNTVLVSHTNHEHSAAVKHLFCARYTDSDYSSEDGFMKEHKKQLNSHE